MSVPSIPQNFSFTIDKNSIIYSWESVSGADGYRIYSGNNLITDIKRQYGCEQMLISAGNIDNAPKLVSDIIDMSKFNAPLNVINVLEDKREVVERTLFNRIANLHDITSFISEQLNFEDFNSETNLNLAFDDKTGYIKLTYNDIFSRLGFSYQTDNTYIEKIVQEKNEAVHIIAYNEFGESSKSGSIVVKTIPNTPKNFEISMVETDILLSWSNNSLVNDGYKIFKRENENVGWVCIATIEDKNVTTYRDSNEFSLNKLYEYKICSYNDIGDSLPTSTGRHYIPYEPSWRYIDNKIEIGFKDNVKADSYKIKYRINNGNYITKEILNTHSDYTTSIITSITDIISLSICAVFEGKETCYSNEITVSGQSCEELEVLDFKLFFVNNNDMARIQVSSHNRGRGYRVIYKVNNTPYTTIDLEYNSNSEYYHDVRMMNNFDILTAQFEVYDFFGSVRSEFKEIIYIKESSTPPQNVRRAKTLTGFRLDWDEATLSKYYHVHLTINGVKQEVIKVSANYFEKEVDYNIVKNISIQVATEIINGNVSDLSEVMIFSPTIKNNRMEMIVSNDVVKSFASNMILGNKGVITKSPLTTISFTPNNKQLFELMTLTYLPIEKKEVSCMLLSNAVEKELILNQLVFTKVKTSFIDSYINYEKIESKVNLQSTIVTKLKIQHPIHTEIHGVRILTIGDSITAGHPNYWAETNTGDERSQYQYWLNKRLNGDFEIINKGYGSDTTDRLLTRFEKDVLNQNARYCIIQGGTNDIYWAMAESQGSQEHLDKKLNTMKNNIMEMVTLSLQNKIIPIVGTLIPRTGAIGIYKTALFDFNEWIINYCNDTDGVYYVDFFNAGKQNVPPTPLEDPNQRGALNPHYDGDALFDEYGNMIKQGRGIHPNIDGYRIMAEAIPLSIFQTSQGSVKLFIDPECKIEETVDESDKLNPKYIIDVSTLRKGRTKRITRYIKNSTFSPVIYSLYHSNLKEMDVKLSVNDGEFKDLANSYLVVEGIHKIIVELSIPRNAQTPSVDLHLVNKRLQTIQ